MFRSLEVGEPLQQEASKEYLSMILSHRKLFDTSRLEDDDTYESFASAESELE